MFPLSTFLPLHKLAVVFKQKKWRWHSWEAIDMIGFLYENEFVFVSKALDTAHAVWVITNACFCLPPYCPWIFSSPFFLCTTCCLFCITMCHAWAIAWPRIRKVSEISTIVNFIKLFLQEELDNLASNFPNRFNIYYVLNQVLFLLYDFESNGRFFNFRLISCIFVSVLFSQH